MVARLLHSSTGKHCNLSLILIRTVLSRHCGCVAGKLWPHANNI